MSKITVTYAFDSEEEVRAHFGAAPTATPTPAPAPAAEPEARTVAADEVVPVDAIGMPYDPAIHTEKGTKNADGTWKARKGYADQAKTAREEFLARGGADPDTQAPEPAPAPTGAMPGMEPAPAAPVVGAMPGMEPAPAPTPRAVELTELVAKTTGMMERGAIAADGLKAMYAELNITNPAAFNDDADLRAAMYAKLCEVEPDA